MSSPFDTKLEHVLNNYLNATGADHHIRKTFIQEEILTFEDFTFGCTVENIKTFQQDDGTNNLVHAFSSVKLTLITNVILYYNFLIDDNQEVLAEDPVNWVLLDFKRWRRNPPVTTNITVSTATTTPVFTDIESNGEIISKDVAAADDDIDNAKSPLIGDLDGMNDEYYQEKK